MRLTDDFGLPGQPGYETNQDIVAAAGSGGTCRVLTLDPSGVGIRVAVNVSAGKHPTSMDR